MKVIEKIQRDAVSGMNPAAGWRERKEVPSR
jgi:hypothetical protein